MQVPQRFSFDSFIACSTSPLVEVVHPSFLMFARREFVGRRINTSTDLDNLKILLASGQNAMKSTPSGKILKFIGQFWGVNLFLFYETCLYLQCRNPRSNQRAAKRRGRI
jgi:hypothetical protein